jgi:hypothetical protein
MRLAFSGSSVKAADQPRLRSLTHFDANWLYEAGKDFIFLCLWKLRAEALCNAVVKNQVRFRVPRASHWETSCG